MSLQVNYVYTMAAIVTLFSLIENHSPENIAEVENGPDEEWRTTDPEQQQPTILYIFFQLYENK